jgi:hypothetical protein
MPENITIESEPSDDPDVVWVTTNLNLTGGDETEEYDSPEEGAEGSPVAQALFLNEGLQALRLDGSEMRVQRAPGVAWHDLLEDLRATLIDFFL